MSEQRRGALLSGVAALPRAEGSFLLDGATAVLKGMLESEIEVGGMVTDTGPLLARAFLASQDPTISLVLKRNRCAVLRRRTPERRLVEAGRLAAKTEHGVGVAVILNAEVPRAVAALERGGEEARPGTVLLVVDDPEGHPAIASLPLLVGLGLVVLEPRNLDTLRWSIQHAARLAGCVAKPVAIIADEMLFHSRGMLEVAPNREVDTLDAAIALRRRRQLRVTEDSAVLDLARPLDLTHTTAMPSPGEREPLGIISTGVASTAVAHVLEEHRLTGRVPTAQLQLVNPIDPGPIERMLSRCLRVVLLETRPGRLAGAVLAIAEGLRRRGEPVAELSWEQLKDDGTIVLELSDAARPSILMKKIGHFLEPVRPSLNLQENLQATDELLMDGEIPPRRGRRERARLLNSIQRSVVAAERALREGDEDHEPLALAINGRQPVGFAGQVRSVEILERHDLLQQIVPMVASRGDRPWVLVISDSASNEELNASRLVSAAVPSDLPNPPTVRDLAFTSEADLSGHVQTAARATEPSIIVVRRSVAPGVLRADLEEIDRLGYAQAERFRSTVDLSCGVRLQDDEVEDRDVVSPSEIPGHLEIERDRGQRSGWFQLRVRPLVEFAEVLRNRPPLPLIPVDANRDLPAPTLIHATNGEWRAHVAGTRGAAEGAAACSIILAGVEMGFDVRSLNSPELIGAGRRAWAQILFTRSLSNQRPAARTAGIPYGEADLLLGSDPVESTRALGSDSRLRVASPSRTSFVVNTELLSDQREINNAPITESLEALAKQYAMGDTSDLRLLARVVERQFGNDRLVDMVLLGIAFQHGLIPVTTAAMQSAVAQVEESGFGRSGEAFVFGRQLVAGERRPRLSEPVRTAQSVLREVVLERRFSRGSREAMRLRARLQLALDRMPGLSETEAGRAASIDFLLAAGALVRWGSKRAVEKFVETVEEAYRCDRGDTGRELTRTMILVLGEASLMRDLPYAAAVALSIEHRRRVRRRLGVRTGRGDSFDIAYLLQADLYAFSRRIRVQLPAREWLLRVVIGIGRTLPLAIRGRTIDRQRRAYVMGCVDRALSETRDPVRYRAWCKAFSRIHERTAEGSFHTLTLSEIETLLTT